MEFTLQILAPHYTRCLLSIILLRGAAAQFDAHTCDFKILLTV